MLVLVIVLLIDPSTQPRLDYDHEQEHEHELMNILLIQLKRIGDLILTTPAIAALREKFPEATLSLVVSPAVEGLLPAISGVDKVFVVRGKADDALDWIALAWGKFDYCLDFTRNDRSSFLTLLSQARKRITSDHPNLRTKIRARSYNEFVESPVRHLHTVDYHLGLLKPLGIHDASRAIRLDLPDSTVEKAEQLLKSAQAGDEFVILHPGSARAEKFWEAERWARLIDHCVQEREMKCVLTGGRSPMERTQIATIKSSTRSEVIDLSGKTDLLTPRGRSCARPACSSRSIPRRCTSPPPGGLPRWSCLARPIPFTGILAPNPPSFSWVNPTAR